MTTNLPKRWTVINPLTGGGMSDTMLCFDSHLRRQVVFKTLKPGTSQKRILDELAALSAIRSDHVVQLISTTAPSQIFRQRFQLCAQSRPAFQTFIPTVDSIAI